MSDATESHLRSLASDLLPYAIDLVYAARAAGIPLVVISGRRSAAVNREVGGSERSLHLYGHAFDVQVLGYRRDQLPFWFWESLGQYWESMGGRWGGRFTPPDVNHFDVGLLA